MRRPLAAALALAAGLLAADAGAHVLSRSQSRWEITPTGARVEFRIPADELAHLPPDTVPDTYWPARLQLLAGGEPCPADAAVRSSTAARGWTAWRWEVRRDTDAPLALRSDLLRGLVPQHVHLARLVDAGGDVRERILVDRDPVWDLAREARDGASFAGYLFLGVEHILGGWNHLAFVIALILLAGSFGEILKLVTGFTVAHSVTLGLAALGLLRPDGGAVEVLIGASIALVAAENCWLLGERSRAVPVACAGALVLAAAASGGPAAVLPPLAWCGLALFTVCHFGLLDTAPRPALLRAGMALVFGLVHGFGFGGALMELGLPADRIVPSLLGFNLGVEAGQILVVLAVYPALRLLARTRAPAARLAAEAGSAAVFAVGLFWVITRAW